MQATGVLWGPMWGPLAACAARRAGDWSCPPPLRSTYKLSSMQSPTFSGLRHHTAACFICMKWTVSRDFLPLVFFMILIHLGPVFNAEVLLFSHILYCSFDFTEIFTCAKHSSVSLTPKSESQWCQLHRGVLKNRYKYLREIAAILENTVL